MEALVLIGACLTLTGSTRPGSGSEHHLSHFFEIVGLIHDQPYFLHGTDVAYSTVVTAGMREELVKLSAPEFHPATREQRLAAYDRIFASFAGEVLKIQDEAGSYERNLNPVYDEKGQLVYTLNPHITGYNSENYNAKIEAAYAAEDVNVRTALLHEAEAMLMQDIPAIPIVYNQNVSLCASQLSRVSSSFFCNAVFNRAKLSGYWKIALRDEFVKEDDEDASLTTIG
jgi:glycerol dehydrogenase-like iron-containing ADH family enzyme